MKLLWPRLPADVATALFVGLDNDGALPLAADSHPAQVYAQVGGACPIRT